MFSMIKSASSNQRPRFVAAALATLVSLMAPTLSFGQEAQPAAAKLPPDVKIVFHGTFGDMKEFRMVISLNDLGTPPQVFGEGWTFDKLRAALEVEKRESIKGCADRYSQTLIQQLYKDRKNLDLIRDIQSQKAAQGRDLILDYFYASQLPYDAKLFPNGVKDERNHVGTFQVSVALDAPSADEQFRQNVVSKMDGSGKVILRPSIQYPSEDCQVPGQGLRQALEQMKKDLKHPPKKAAPSAPQAPTTPNSILDLMKQKPPGQTSSIENARSDKPAQAPLIQVGTGSGNDTGSLAE